MLRFLLLSLCFSLASCRHESSNTSPQEEVFSVEGKSLVQIIAHSSKQLEKASIYEVMGVQQGSPNVAKTETEQLKSTLENNPKQILYLPEVKALSKNSAEIISTFKGVSVSLNALPHMDKATADALVSFSGRALYLHGLQRLDHATVLSLSRFKGEIHTTSTISEQISQTTLRGNGYTAKLIAPGRFSMGCPKEYHKGCADDSRYHEVSMPNAFYMMQSEVTQGLYAKVMNKNPSQFISCGDACPVERVSWYAALRFANALSEQEGLEKCYKITGEDVNWDLGTSCLGWRLPTEAEWEYAARGESDQFTNTNPNGTGFLSGWVGDGVQDSSVEACKNERNGYELCDMAGNVFEWVWDKYSFYDQSPQTDPIMNFGDPANRLLRGGGYGTEQTDFPVFWRVKAPPKTTANNVGFRLCRTIK